MRDKVPFLRGLAVLAILLGHVALYAQDPLQPVRGEVLTSTGVDRWIYWLLGTPTQVGDFAVPAFYVMAGLLCVPSMRSDARGRYLGRQAVGLLTPLLLWSFVAVGVTYAVGSIPSMPVFLRSRLALGQVEWGYALPLALLQFYLVTPLILRTCERRPGLVLGVAFAVQAAAIGLRLSGSLTGSLADIPTLGASAGQYAIWRWCGFFVAGLVLGLHPEPARRWLLSRRRILWIVTGAGLGLALLEAEYLPELTRDSGWISLQVRPGSTLYAFGGLALYFGAPRPEGPWVRRIARIGGVAFALLLLHPIVFRVLQRVLALLGPLGGSTGLELLRLHPLLAGLAYLLLGAVPLVWCMVRLYDSRWRSVARRVLGH